MAVASAGLTYFAVTWVRHGVSTQLDVHDIGTLTFKLHINIAIRIIHQAIVSVFVVPRIKLFVIELAQRPEVVCQRV